MDRLCDRASACMTMLISLAALLIWVAVSTEGSVVHRTLDLIDVLETSLPESQSTEIRALLEAERAARASRSFSALPATLLTSISLDQVAALRFPDRPEREHVRTRLIDKTEIGHPVPLNLTTPEYAKVQAAAILSDLRLSIAPIEVNAKTTLGEVNSRASTQITVPGLGISISSLAAFWTLAMLSLAPMLLLFSVAASIEVRAGSVPGAILDWLPLHPGKHAYWVGCVWLWTSPVLLALLPMVVDLGFRSRASAFLGVAVVSGCSAVLAAATVARVGRIREAIGV